MIATKYNYILERILTPMRVLSIALGMAACAVVATAQETTPTLRTDSVTIEPRHWYIKTNGIGWAMGIANVSFEFEVAKHLSFTIPMYYSGWDFPKHTTKLRTLAYQPELRYWLKHEGGFFGGVHFGIAWWNVATGDEYRRQDHNGHYPAYGGGVSVGYRTVPKNNRRLRWEFSLGGGYYHLYYDRFYNIKDGAKVDTKSKNKFLLDNATVSLVYTFKMHDKIR